MSRLTAKPNLWLIGCMGGTIAQTLATDDPTRWHLDEDMETRGPSLFTVYYYYKWPWKCYRDIGGPKENEIFATVTLKLD